MEQNSECFLAAKESAKRGTRKHPLQNPSRVSFHHFIRQVAPGIMEVYRLDFDIRVEDVRVEENHASHVLGHVEPTSKNVMVNIFNCFLQRDDVPLACDLFLKSTFFSTSRSWIPVVDAESFLHRRTIRHFVVEVILLRCCRCLLADASRNSATAL